MKEKSTTGLALIVGALALASVAPPSLSEAPPAREGTTVEALVGYLRQSADELEERGDHWLATLKGGQALVYAHAGHDRMRILTPVADARTLGRRELETLLEANYDRALDAKYSLSNGFVWSVYAHPLSTLTAEEVASALRQVVALKRNYGTSFASTGKVFGDPH